MPSGFLILGAAGAGGGGASSGVSFFLGKAITPESPVGPPASGAAWSAGCGGVCGVCGAGVVDCDQDRGDNAAANDTTSNAASGKLRREETDGRKVDMTTSV